MKELILIGGGGGHCRSCIDVIEQEQKFKIAGIIDKKDLPEIILNKTTYLRPGLGEKFIEAFSSLKNALQEPEKVHILQVLKEVGWNKKKAAIKLGVNRTTLYNKLRKYNITSEPSKK